MRTINIIKCFLVSAITVTLLSGCVINMPLSGALSPLEEKRIEGKGESKILLLPLSGFISQKPSTSAGGLKSSPSTVSVIKEALQKAQQDDDIKAVVLKINSPGGEVAASDIIFREIALFKEKTGTPVYASITGVGASGAYFIALATDRIYAQPTSITGSIGVIAVTLNFSGLMEKVGITDQTVKSGRMKDVFSPLRKQEAPDMEVMQGLIDTLYEKFLHVVHSERNSALSTKTPLRTIADGRPYGAEEALALGLIDRLGYLDEVISDIKTEAGIKGEVSVVTYLRPGGYAGSIYSLKETSEPVSTLNLQSLSSLIAGSQGPEFLYLWSP